MALSPGTCFGPYEIVEPLGAGGMGEVYRARDSRLNRTVALKVLAAHVSADVEFRARFEREARAIAALNHPHICTLHDLGRHEGIDYLVMEHLEGQTLAERLRRGALPVHQAVTIAIDIAGALDSAHRQGIVHRDLKPGNIMLTKGGAKLLDFGLATISPVGTGRQDGLSTSETVAGRLTSPGAIVGTVQYMAPEQLEGRDADARSDVYSFGVVLYEMLTGTLPFDGTTPAGRIAAILTSTPRTVTQLQPLVPLSLNHVVATCLMRDPDARWQSVRDIAHSLNGITETSSTVNDVTPVRRTGRGEPLAWLAAGIGLLAALAVWAGALYAPPPQQAAAAVRATIPLGPGQRLAITQTPTFALSPDGTVLAYVVAAGSGTELYLRRLDSMTATLVADSRGASYPLFSPDSKKIAFLAGDGLRWVPLAGGAPVTVVPTGTFAAVRGLLWGSDGAFIISTFQSGLMRVPELGGVPVALTKPNFGAREKSHRWPSALPDGQGVLMTVSTADATTFNEARVEMLRPDTELRTTLIDGGSFARYVPTGHLLFTRAGTLYAAPFELSTHRVTGTPASVLTPVRTEPAFGHAHFDISETGTLAYVSSGEHGNNRTFLWVDARGNRTAAIVSRRPFTGGVISPDGTRVAAVVEGATAEVWVQDLHSDKSTRLAFGWDNGNPVWMPDGERIAFSSTRGASRVNNLFVQAADGTGVAEQLSTSANHQYSFGVSPDGQRLLFTEQNAKDAGWDVRSLSLRDRSVSVLPESPRLSEQRLPALSHDGRWVAYHSNHSGRDEVYVQAFPEGGRKWQVSTGGGTSPVWSPTGEEMYYRRGDTVMVASIERRRAIAFHSETPRVVFKTELIGPVAVAPDGRLLMIEPEKEDEITELTIIVNWFDELKRLTSATR